MYSMYADGSCQPNPGTGGWAFIIRYTGMHNDLADTDAGSEQNSTNNRMELTAVMKGLQFFINNCKWGEPLLITLDSKYVLDGMQTWSKNWIKRGWKKKDGKPVLNDDLWKQIVNLQNEIETTCKSRVQFAHIKGHTGHEWNEKMRSTCGCRGEEMQSIFPRYGVTGNGKDTWWLDIYWGGARRKKQLAVQSVYVFRAKKIREHSTISRTESYAQLEYMRTKQRALDKMEELRKTDPVRPVDDPKSRKAC